MWCIIYALITRDITKNTPRSVYFMQDRYVQGSMYQDQLHITYTPGDSLKNPKMVLTIQNFNRGNGAHKQLRSLILDKCGGSIVDEKHHYKYSQKNKYDPIDLVVTISGYRGVEEAVHVLLTHAANEGIPDPVYPNNILNPYSDPTLTEQTLQQIKVNTNQQRKAIDQQRNKTKLLKAKNINKYTATKPVSIKSANPVLEVKSLSKSNQEKIDFLKKNVGAITEIQSFNSRLFELLLGSDHVGKVNPVVDDDGIRIGTVSRGIEGFQSLHDYLQEKKKPIDWDQFTELLIQKGYGKIDVANLIFSDPDAHWDNIGFNLAGELVRIDFDRSLWPLTCQYLGTDPEKEFHHDKVVPNEAFIVDKVDLLSLPYLKYAKPYNGTVAEYTKRLPAFPDPLLPGKMIHPSKEFLDKMQNHPKFDNDKWYICLKYLLLGNNIYISLLNAYISSEKRKYEIFLYLEDRRNVFEQELLSTPEFCQYVIDNPAVIKDIIQEFNVLNDKDIGKKSSLHIDIDDIQSKYKMINTTILETKKIIDVVTEGIVDSEIDDFKNYLKINPQIMNSKFSKRENTALDLAIINGHLDIVKLLLANGANPNTKDIDGCSALHIAAINSNPEITKALLQNGADPNSRDKDGWTPFYYAARGNRTKEALNVTTILCGSMELDQQDKDGVTQLHIAASNGDMEVVAELLNAGANPNIATRKGLTAFYFAAKHNNHVIMNQLVNNSNFEKNKIETSPLYHAAYFGNIDIVNLLLQVGADPNAKNIAGNTLLHMAASNGHIEVLQVLLNIGANPETKNIRSNKTPLDYAMKNKHAQCAKEILIAQYKDCVKKYKILTKKADSEIKILLEEVHISLISVGQKLSTKNMTEMEIIRNELETVVKFLKKMINPKTTTKTQQDFANTTPYPTQGLFHQPHEAQAKRPPQKVAAKTTSVKDQKDIQQTRRDITKTIDDLIIKIFKESELLPNPDSEIFMLYAMEAEKIMFNTVASIEERIKNAIAVITDFVHTNHNANQFSLELKHITQMCEDAGIKIYTNKTCVTHSKLG